MLALLGFGIVVLFTVLVMWKKLSAVTALILVPVIIGVIAGFGADLGDMMIEGIVQSAPTAVMLAFALLYFLVMYECGLFEPFVRLIIAKVGDDPVKIVVATAVLVMVVGLDGDGATAVLITISSMYPIYRRVGINPLIMGLMLGLICPILNWMPWGGPAARMAVSLDVEIADIVVPMLPAFFISLASTLVFAYILGRSERRRLRKLVTVAHGGGSSDGPESSDDDNPGFTTPRTVIETKNFWFNFPLTIALMVGLATGIAPLPALAMAAFAIAATVNFPNIRIQQERLKPHAGTVVLLVTLILAAGAFTGILSETGMVQAMADSIISVIPEGWGGAMGFVTAIVSMPLLIVLSNDAFFFGVVPILAETGAAFGVPPEVIGRAALIGMPTHSLSPLIAPIYLVATLLRTDIGALQRFAAPWTVALSLISIAGAAVTSAIYIAWPNTSYLLSDLCCKESSLRFITYLAGNQEGVGIKSVGGYRGLSVADLGSDLQSFLGDDAEVRALADRLSVAPEITLDDAQLMPPITRPGKILCIGLNYVEHSQESGFEIPTYPAVFARFANNLIAHGQPLVRPTVSDLLDYECELAVVIGRGGRHISERDALTHVGGYSIFNDGSVRDFQIKSAQWTMGKTFDGTGAFGPELITRDELPEGCAGLEIRTILNGEVMQQANTDDLIFDVARLVAILSEAMTLDPGDVIVTGTPGGVGALRTPQVWLKPGDQCTIEIEQLGSLTNTVVQE